MRVSGFRCLNGGLNCKMDRLFRYGKKRQRSWAIPTSLTLFDVTLRRNLRELKSSAQSINETSVLGFHFAIYL